MRKCKSLILIRSFTLIQNQFYCSHIYNSISIFILINFVIVEKCIGNENVLLFMTSPQQLQHTTFMQATLISILINVSVCLFNKFIHHYIFSLLSTYSHGHSHILRDRKYSHISIKNRRISNLHTRTWYCYV